MRVAVPLINYFASMIVTRFDPRLSMSISIPSSEGKEELGITTSEDLDFASG